MLIGEKGQALEEIEELTNTEITVEGVSVEIDGEAFDEWTAKDIVKAIGRGFPPEKALRLLGKDTGLVVIDVKDLTSTKKERHRKKGRVIGKNGKARRHMEKMTGTDICVYGNTVSIIGELDEMEDAKQAVLQLIRGAQHASVYRYLEDQRRMKKNSHLL